MGLHRPLYLLVTLHWTEFPLFPGLWLVEQFPPIVDKPLIALVSNLVANLLCSPPPFDHDPLNYHMSWKFGRVMWHSTVWLTREVIIMSSCCSLMTCHQAVCMIDAWSMLVGMKSNKSGAVQPIWHHSICNHHVFSIESDPVRSARFNLFGARPSATNMRDQSLLILVYMKLYKKRFGLFGTRPFAAINPGVPQGSVVIPSDASEIYIP